MGRVKDSLESVIGKTISSVVVTKNETSAPTSQLFLVFSDGTSFEFWVNDAELSMASKVDDEDLAVVTRHANQRSGSRVHVFAKTKRQSCYEKSVGRKYQDTHQSSSRIRTKSREMTKNIMGVLNSAALEPE